MWNGIRAQQQEGTFGVDTNVDNNGSIGGQPTPGWGFIFDSTRLSWRCTADAPTVRLASSASATFLLTRFIFVPFMSSKHNRTSFTDVCAYSYRLYADSKTRSPDNWAIIMINANMNVNNAYARIYTICRFTIWVCRQTARVFFRWCGAEATNQPQQSLYIFTRMRIAHKIRAWYPPARFPSHITRNV